MQTIMKFILIKSVFKVWWLNKLFDGGCTWNMSLNLKYYLINEKGNSKRHRKLFQFHSASSFRWQLFALQPTSIFKHNGKTKIIHYNRSEWHFLLHLSNGVKWMGFKDVFPMKEFRKLPSSMLEVFIIWHCSELLLLAWWWWRKA
jgi:hypothetical protein